MKKIIFSLLIIFLGTTIAFSQEEQTNEPITDAFNSTINTDNQTVYTPFKGGLELIIQHRFARMKEITDLFGIYGASNIRMALNYGITNKLMVHFGTEKAGKLQDFGAKYAILQQKPKGMPVSVSLYCNLTIDGRDKEGYGTKNYKYIDRLSYLYQIIVARKFSDRISLQVSGGNLHVNKVDSIYQNEAFAINVSGKCKVFKKHSFIVEYGQGFWLKGPIRYWQKDPQMNFGAGWEIATSTHCFQIIASSFDKLNPIYNFNFNQKKVYDKNISGWNKTQMMFGFNISVRL